MEKENGQEGRKREERGRETYCHAVWWFMFHGCYYYHLQAANSNIQSHLGLFKGIINGVPPLSMYCTKRIIKPVYTTPLSVPCFNILE